MIVIAIAIRAIVLLTHDFLSNAPIDHTNNIASPIILTIPTGYMYDGTSAMSDWLLNNGANNNPIETVIDVMIVPKRAKIIPNQNMTRINSKNRFPTDPDVDFLSL